MASLHQSRLQRKLRNQGDATVYGTVSNGFAFVLLKITHDGVLQQSRRFEVTEGETLTVLGCLKYMLEMSVSMSPDYVPQPECQSEADEEWCFAMVTLTLPRGSERLC